MTAGQTSLTRPSVQGPRASTTQPSCKIPSSSLPALPPLSVRHACAFCPTAVVSLTLPSALSPPLGGQTDLCRCECPHAPPCAERLPGPPFFLWATYKDSPRLGLGAWRPAFLLPRATRANPSSSRPQKHHAPVSHRALARATPLPGSPWSAALSGSLPLPPHPAVSPPSSFTAPHLSPSHTSEAPLRAWCPDESVMMGPDRGAVLHGEGGEPRARTPSSGVGVGAGAKKPDPSRALWPETWGRRSISLRSRLLSQSPPAALDPELWSPIDHCMQGRQQVPHKCQSAG